MRITLVIVGAVAIAACGGRGEPTRSHDKGLIVLGIDGMDPKLVRKYIDAGQLPHLAALEQRGSFHVLPTTMPPQSPVAWSTFVTGQGAAGHGIYDFVHRDPKALAPYLSTSRIQGGGTLSSAKNVLLRKGQTFWQALDGAGIPATVVKIPANFPPPGAHGSKTLTGMGTPDLLGTYGTYQAYREVSKTPLAGGIAHAVQFTDQRARAVLRGPAKPGAANAFLTVPVELIRDTKRGVAVVEVGGVPVLLTPGEWSSWIPVSFDPGVLSRSVGGMVRLHLVSLRPFELYVSPINLDPLRPAAPLSEPPVYAAELARDVGRYYTQGMAEDTKALSSGVLSPEAFLAQWRLVLRERQAILDRELKRYRGGALFLYFSSIDQLSHVFFRSLAADAPPEAKRWAHVIPDAYKKLDAVVGKVIKRAGPDTQLVVMSDHGFAHYRTKVHLNTWLAQRGYLAVLPPDKRRPVSLGHIDWSRTQAYALGLNQLFVNLRGREAQGTVAPEDKDALLRRLGRDLRKLRDPTTGQRVITELVYPDATGPDDRRPDVLVGYNRGYRSSDESALGQIGETVLEPNSDQWSGDHCMAPRHVPGVLFTSWRQPRPPEGLADLAPTILDYFDVAVPDAMAGTTLWRGTRTARRSEP